MIIEQTKRKTMSRSQSTACHIQGLAEYVDNVILFQLCLLVIQRLALTISPLKVHLLMTRKHVMKAIGVTVMASLIVDTLFISWTGVIYVDI
jgi:hypothetical protein